MSGAPAGGEARAQQDRRAKDALRELGHDQRPDPVSEEGERDADHSVAQSVRQHVAVGDEAEPHLPLKEALGNDRQAGDGEDEGERADDRHQLVHVEKTAIIGAATQTTPATRSQAGGREERRTGMTRLKLRPLHQGRPIPSCEKLREK